MFKLGSELEIGRGHIHMWGYDVVRLWLVKDMRVYRNYSKTHCYKIMGACQDEEGKYHGWCTVADGTLKQMRAFMNHYVTS